jgi:inositol polyphosphate 5-phosphatase INPP5B/F
VAHLAASFNTQSGEPAGSAKTKDIDSASMTDTVDDKEDPDLIVLGFQELDLSTGALLYSTETTREDAWFNAVLAGLGEKAVQYEKVSCGNY